MGCWMLMRINLDSIEKCRDLCNLCNRYKELKIDVCHSRYLVDARSFLGLLTLVFHDVSLFIRPEEDIDDFINELIKLGGYKS